MTRTFWPLPSRNSSQFLEQANFSHIHGLEHAMASVCFSLPSAHQTKFCSICDYVHLVHHCVSNQGHCLPPKEVAHRAPSSILQNFVFSQIIIRRREVFHPRLPETLGKILLFSGLIQFWNIPQFSFTNIYFPLDISSDFSSLSLDMLMHN